MIENSYLITSVIAVNNTRVFPNIKVTCDGTITNWIVGLPSSLLSPRHVHLQLRRSNGLVTALDMNTSYAESISDINANVYNFTVNIAVRNGDHLVIVGTNSDPIYCQKHSGPQNYMTNNQKFVNNNDYPLISAKISQ